MACAQPSGRTLQKGAANVLQLVKSLGPGRPDCEGCSPPSPPPPLPLGRVRLRGRRRAGGASQISRTPSTSLCIIPIELDRCQLGDMGV